MARLAARDLSNRRIAETLVIAEKTAGLRPARCLTRAWRGVVSGWVERRDMRERRTDMYVTRNESEVTLGRPVEYESTIDELAGLNQQMPGYIGATLLQSYGNPTRYTHIGRWTDREAARAAVRSEQFSAFARSALASGLFRPVRLPEAYESVFEVDNTAVPDSASTCEVLVDWTLKNAMVAPAFEAFAHDVADLMKQSSVGFVSSRLRRFLGNDTRYLTIAIVTDQAAARSRLLTPEVQRFLETHPFTDFATAAPFAETYYVVRRYAGTGAPAAQSAAAAAR